MRAAVAGSAATSPMAPASRSAYEPTGWYGTAMPAPPATSTSAGASECTTGVPWAKASTIGSPNPSARLGITNTVARS